ncbi:MAG: sigma-70 family RNA polymerase sigma factor [Phycisphaerae bacterium]
MNDGILKFTLNRIHFKARQMMGHHGFTENDFDDLRQELMLDVLRRLPKFRDDRGGIKIFICDLIDNRIADLVDYHEAQCRDRRRVDRSLDEEAREEDGEQTSFGETITEDDARGRLGRRDRSRQEQAELALDMAATLGRLDEADRRLCLQLMVKTPLEIARETGARRGGIYERIARIRGKFAAAGLHRYL